MRPIHSKYQFSSSMRVLGLSLSVTWGLNVSAFAAETQATEQKSTISPPVNITTVDNPLPYRYLDWLSPEDIKALPESERPIIEGVCEGLYSPPIIQVKNPQQDPAKAPVEASADHYESDPEGRIKLSGQVVVQQGGRQLESDTITIHQKTRETSMEGNVRIRQEGMLMTGKKAQLNLNTKNLSLEDAEYVVHESHIRGTATRIHNEDTSTLVLDKSSYTTCEPGSNAWLFEANDIRLNKESGWGTAKHAVIRVKDVPVFYFPWLMFPIDERRQTGFLFPSFSSGEESGTQIALPYYLNLAPNYDATLTPRHMTERGSQLEGEFRYLTQYGQGELGAAYLPSDDAFNGESRKLLLWQHGGYFTDHWYSKLNYTRVSDQDYFNDLGTNLNAKSRTHLNQSGELGYNGDQWGANVKIQAYQTLDKVIADANLPYRKVPQFTLHGAWDLGESQWRTFWKSEVTHFEHPEDDYSGITAADRMTLTPGIEYRYRKPWAFATPRLTLIHSQYEFDSPTSSEQLNEDQTLYRASFDSGLYFDRMLDVSGTQYTQTLEPRLFYLYTPFEAQNHRQTFDSSRFTFDYSQLFRENRFTGSDRYGDANQVSLGLTTRFIEEDTGMERFRASMGQIYYFDDRKVQLDESTATETSARSAWVGQAEWRISNDMRTRADLQWDESANNIDRASLSLNYRTADNAIFNAAYRYTDDGAATSASSDKIKQTDLSFLWPVNKAWSLMGRWGYDVEYARSFENLIGVEYDSCCWKVRLVNRRYLEEDSSNPLDVEPQRGIFLQFQLKGLGGVGNELDNILSDSISGFADREQQKSDIY